MSVDMATISACIRGRSRPGENVARHSSGRFLPVAIPSLADWVWINIAIRLAATTTHSSM
jgi:hypothetical protein